MDHWPASHKAASAPEGGSSLLRKNRHKQKQTRKTLKKKVRQRMECDRAKDENDNELAFSLKSLL